MKDKFNKILSSVKGLRRNRSTDFNYAATSSYSSFNFQRPRSSSTGETNIKVVVAVVAVGLIIVSFLFGRLTSPKSQVLSASTNDSQTVVNPPIAQQNINKDFNFSLKDDKGNPVGSFKYTIVSAETNNEIILKGQKNYSVAGREFLIIDLKLTNDNKQSLQVNTRDYIRLSANGNDSELLAPDIHNDPVEVQAISTEETRVGFVISTTDRKLKLIVGEINGPKTDINLNLQ